MMKELESSHLKNTELTSRMDILSSALNDSLASNERLAAANDVNMTMQDYAANVCKIWFGDPCTVDNWCRKNTKVFHQVKSQVDDLAKRIGEWQLEDKEATNGSRR